jgi:hypothetical protein
LKKSFNLRIFKELADLGKIRHGFPKLATCKFSSNLPLFSKIRQLFFSNLPPFSKKSVGVPQMLHFGLSSS